MPEPGEALVMAGLTPVHPGGFFARRILGPRGITVHQAAFEMEVDPQILAGFVEELRSVDQNLAGKLAHFTKTSPTFWLNMQAAADLGARSK